MGIESMNSPVYPNWVLYDWAKGTHVTSKVTEMIHGLHHSHLKAVSRKQ